MRVRRRVRAGAAGLVLLAAIVGLMSAARATPSRKFSAVVLADGRLPAGGHYRTQRDRVEVDSLTAPPGGHSGWHSHEGPVLIVVKRGTLVNYVARNGRCVRTLLRAGQTLLESAGQVHLARNEGTRDVVFIAVNNYRNGGPGEVDAERPAACDV